LNGYPVDMLREFAEWPPAVWPFFDLAAQFDAEFGWREQDRIIHLYLPPREAERFMALLAWAHDIADAGPHSSTAPAAGGLPHVSAADLYAFYDGGRDSLGLRAWRAIRDNPGLWRARDAATDLFFPLPPLREGRYFKALLGLLGWTGLLAAYALPWLALETGSALDLLLDLWPLCLGVWLVLSTPDWTPKKRFSFVGAPTAKAVEIPFDLKACVFFPFWAFGRRLYLRGVISLVAWGAVLQQMITMGDDFRSHAGPFLLAVCLHAAAGVRGQRWVMNKLLRTVGAADRAGLRDPARRWLYIRQRRTGDPKISRQFGGAFTVLWCVFVAIMLALGLLRRLHMN
jgi:hypothetical protein